MIRVFGQSELEEFLENDGTPHSHLISIVNPGRHSGYPQHIMPDLFRRKYTDILELRFWDAQNREEVGKLRPKTIPQMRHARRVLRFIRQNPNASGFDIHCWQGISRSTAVALGILYSLYRDEERASDLLVATRRQAMPNKRLVQYFDRIFGSDLADYRKTIYKSRMKRLRNDLKFNDAISPEL